MAFQSINYVTDPRAGHAASPALIDRRREMDRRSHVIPERVQVRAEAGAPIAGEWVEHIDAHERPVVLYLHGSGYRAGSSASHRELVARIAEAACIRAFVADYRLTPEAPFPAAVIDALAAYKFVLGVAGAKSIVFIGDSAGGGLALGTLLAAGDEGLPMPAAAITMSAWTDLAVTGCGTSDTPIEDPIVTEAMLRSAADGYLGGADPYSPYASPLYGDLEMLPPLLMQVGGREIMASDTVRFAERARASGVHVEVEIYEGMTHVFQLHAATEPDGRRAIDRIASFIEQYAVSPNGMTKVGATIPLASQKSANTVRNSR